MDSRILVSKKSVDELQLDGIVSRPEHAPALKRVLGRWQLLALGVGAIIGAGIFVLTGTAAAQYTGPAIVLSFIMGAVACALAGLCYAEFSALVPVAGSAYTYAYVALGEIFAWIIGWDLLLEYMLGTATVAVGWSGYLFSFLQDMGVHLSASRLNWMAITGVAGVAALLISGVKESANFNGAIVLIKLSVIAAFLAVGMEHLHPSNWHPFIPPNQGHFGAFGLSGVMRGAGVVFFAYIGFDAVSAAAQEAKHPQKDMPFAILGSLALCTILYILVARVLTGIVSYKALNVSDPIAVAINNIGLHWLTYLVKIGIILGLGSVMLVLMYAQTRICYTMAKDGLLPEFFGRLHSRLQTPVVATFMLGIVIAFLAALVPINLLGELVSVGTLFAFMIVCAAVLYLRRSQPELDRPFRCPWVPWVPISGILACLYLILGLPGQTLLRLIIWLAFGLVVYFLYGRFHSKLSLQNLKDAVDR